VENVSFHDVAHHSGEPYLHAPWTVSVTSTGITWFTEPYEVNPNANALRFDTIYGFYFDVNVEPGAAKAEIALFKPGLPDSVTANTVGPKPILTDCNHNDVSDRCDVVDCDAVECDTPCGGSRDCNANQVPDECESDCNGNGVADACDIGNCPPNDWTCADCNQNEAPDECDPDCDADGIIDDCEVVVDEDDDCVEDCADLCPTTTPARACCTPYDRIVVCCFSSGIYIQEVFTWSQCLIVDGVPVCDDPPMCPGTPCPDTMCRDGCLVGDGDDDGDLDLRDLAALQSCYSGGVGQSGYDIPPSQCLTPFDFNEDVDVDRQDYRGFHERCSGPRP